MTLAQAHDRVERVHDFRIDLLDVFGLVIDLGPVVRANVDNTREHHAGIDKAATHETAAGLLAN